MATGELVARGARASPPTGAVTTVGALPPAGTRTTTAADRAHKIAVWGVAVTVTMLPLQRPAGPANVTPSDLVIAATIFAAVLWAGRSRAELRGPYVIAAAVFMVGGAFGAMVGPVPGIGLIAVIQDIWLVALAVTIANVVRTPDSLRLVTRAWCVSAIVSSVLILFGVATNNAILAGLGPEAAGGLNLGGRISFTIGDPNYAANYFVISMMVVWATGYPRHRLLRWVVYGLLLSAWLLTGSNSGVVSLGVALTVASLLTIGRRLGVMAMIAAACLALMIALVIVPTFSLTDFQRNAQASKYRLVREGVGHSPDSVNERELLFNETIGLFFQGGVLGQGPVSTKVRLTLTQAMYVKEAHDDYLAALVERGFIGAAGLALLIGSLLLRTWAIAKRPLAAGFVAAVPRTAPLMGAVVGTIVSGTVYELLHVRHVWGLFGLVAAIYLWGRE